MNVCTCIEYMGVYILGGGENKVMNKSKRDNRTVLLFSCRPQFQRDFISLLPKEVSMPLHFVHTV